MKNFIDINSSAMEGKTAGIICTTGSLMSYLASGDLVKILTYESCVLSIQPVAFSSYEDFNGSRLENQKVREKLKSMIEVLVGFLKA